MARSSLALQLLLLLVATFTVVIGTDAPGYVQWSIHKNSEVQSAQIARRSLELQGSEGLRARADSVQVGLGNALPYGLYYANISVGTPLQVLSVQIDTGSSDVWIPSSLAEFCAETRSGYPNCIGGSFDEDKSTTFTTVQQPGDFNISYVDGSGSSGDYFTDTFAIGGATLDNFQMGLALDTDISLGILGIGYNNSEANVYTGSGTVYANLPFALVDNGIIKTEAYSLWLNDLQSADGNVLFGAIDTEKFTGNLISVDVYPREGSSKISSFTVAFTSLSATSSSGTDQITPVGYATAAILDSGTTITLLPDDVASIVFEELGATVSAQLGAVVVPCSLAENSGTLNFGFGGTGGPVIKVAVNDLVLPLTLSSGSTPSYTDGTPACQLGIQAAGELPILFGDTFLRSAYVVYDLANNKIGMAQTKFNTTDSNIVAFASQGAEIPSAATATQQSAVTQSADSSEIPKVGIEPTALVSDAVPLETDAEATESFSAAAGFATNAGSESASSTNLASGSAETTKKSAGGSGPRPMPVGTMVAAIATIGGICFGGLAFQFLI
ncbi:aspartic peptidase domain-containing protein [Calycina marina]|uniref:Probable aspartic-type endopeptidase OPSB n=1 Tax=Calycina marina TaxID=1763456 RepID=A0A9P7Z3K1_9HELO|nr:aspartic peptidase domain-containing protein [Calycina marina]